MAVEQNSQHKTASFSSKIISWWHWCLRSHEHIGNILILLVPATNSLFTWLWEHTSGVSWKTFLARKWFQEDFVTGYSYNHQHQLIFCFGRTGVWIISWQVLLSKSETCIELSSPCMDKGSCPIAWAALRSPYVINLKARKWMNQTFRFWEVQEK